MPPSTSDDALGRAVLDTVQKGTYPDSENITSAELRAAAFPQALELFRSAEDEVKSRIRKASKNTAQDIDGWISQAKQLRSDIETAQRSSEDIFANAKRNEELRQSLNNSSSKLQLLEDEVAFNHDLAASLKKVQGTRHVLREAQDLLDYGDIFKAVKVFLQGESELKSNQKYQNIHAFALLHFESRELRQRLVSAVHQRWHEAVRIDTQNLALSLPLAVKSLDTIATTLQDMGLLDEIISDLSNKLENVIIIPRLHLQANMQDRSLTVEDDTLRVSESSSPTDTRRLFSDMGMLLSFLRTHLPPSVTDPLSKVFGSNLADNLISTRLSSAVPEELSALRGFTNTRSEVYSFSEDLGSYGWSGSDQLRAWTKNIPQVWLQKRQRRSLDEVRQLLKHGFGEIRAVERVETQKVSQQDHSMLQGTTSRDDWNAGWSDEEDTRSINDQSKAQNDTADDEEDASAWGLGDDEDEEAKSKDEASTSDADDGADAWGWGDEEKHEEDRKSPPRKPPDLADRGVNGQAKAHRGGEREMTLRENYNVSSLPTGILDIVSSILSDVDALCEHSPRDFHMESAIPGLCHLPSLLLVMFRAIAFQFYSINDAGSMFLYNDCSWLVEQLRRLAQSRQERAKPSITSKKPPISFDNDIVALEAFGKRSYGKEMESQRTIIKDLLDGAQGFANCTEPPFSQECDLAVSSIVDRLRDIHQQWKSVLSSSALLQSIGSLLSTVVDKIIIDIEDMSDISEPESRSLTAYCKQVVALEDLFLPPAQSGSASHSKEQLPASVPLTAVYAPGWFKFQFLSEILDSSLVDIKYLWTEGGLQQDFETEEIVELIEALFADSEYRRRAIGEIRRSARR